MNESTIKELLSKVDASKKDALLKELTNAKADDIEKILSKYGIKLSKDEISSLMTKATKAMSNMDLGDIAGDLAKGDAKSILKKLI